MNFVGVQDIEQFIYCAAAKGIISIWQVDALNNLLQGAATAAGNSPPARAEAPAMALAHSLTGPANLRLRQGAGSACQPEDSLASGGSCNTAEDGDRQCKRARLAAEAGPGSAAAVQAGAASQAVALTSVQDLMAPASLAVTPAAVAREAPTLPSAVPLATPLGSDPGPSKQLPAAALATAPGSGPGTVPGSDPAHLVQTPAAVLSTAPGSVSGAALGPRLCPLMQSSPSALSTAPRLQAPNKLVPAQAVASAPALAAA